MHGDDRLRGRGANPRTGLITPSHSYTSAGGDSSTSKAVRDQQDCHHQRSLSTLPGQWQADGEPLITELQDEIDQALEAFAGKKRSNSTKTAALTPQPKCLISAASPSPEASSDLLFTIPRKAVGSGRTFSSSSHKQVPIYNVALSNELETWIESHNSHAQRDPIQQTRSVKASVPSHRKVFGHTKWWSPRRHMNQPHVQAGLDHTTNKGDSMPVRAYPVLTPRTKPLRKPPAQTAQISPPIISSSYTTPLCLQEVRKNDSGSGSNDLSSSATLASPSDVSRQKLFDNRTLSNPRIVTQRSLSQDHWQLARYHYDALMTLCDCPWIRNLPAVAWRFILQMLHHLAKTLLGPSSLQHVNQTRIGSGGSCVRRATSGVDGKAVIAPARFLERNSIFDLLLAVVYLIILWVLLRIGIRGLCWIGRVGRVVRVMIDVC